MLSAQLKIESLESISKRRRLDAPLFSFVRTLKNEDPLLKGLMDAMSIWVIGITMSAQRYGSEDGEMKMTKQYSVHYIRIAPQK